MRLQDPALPAAEGQAYGGDQGRVSGGSADRGRLAKRGCCQVLAESRKTKLSDLARVAWQFLVTATACNLWRLPKLATPKRRLDAKTTLFKIAPL